MNTNKIMKWGTNKAHCDIRNMLCSSGISGWNWTPNQELSLSHLPVHSFAQRNMGKVVRWRRVFPHSHASCSQNGPFWFKTDTPQKLVSDLRAWELQPCSTINLKYSAYEKDGFILAHSLEGPSPCLTEPTSLETVDRQMGHSQPVTEQTLLLRKGNRLESSYSVCVCVFVHVHMHAHTSIYVHVGMQIEWGTQPEMLLLRHSHFVCEFRYLSDLISLNRPGCLSRELKGSVCLYLHSTGLTNMCPPQPTCFKKMYSWDQIRSSCLQTNTLLIELSSGHPSPFPLLMKFS